MLLGLMFNDDGLWQLWPPELPRPVMTFPGQQRQVVGTMQKYTANFLEMMPWVLSNGISTAQ